MNKKDSILSVCVLLPLSKIYGFGVGLRNKFFDWGILRSVKFDIPIVVVGNLAIGGTGKTPHTEYLIRLLSEDYKVGVVSRGYKRKTQGFVLASNTSTPNDIGDEPYQMHKKFYGRIKVAVCEKRVVGVRRLLKLFPEINLIILDDAFQHRYLEPSYSLVLTEYNRPVYDDDLLPLGQLREGRLGLNRANVVIATKCPEEISPLDLRLVKNGLNLFPHQHLFFSKYKYGKLLSVFPDYTSYLPSLEWMTEEDGILAVTGIANPKHFTRYLKTYNAKVKAIVFADHHDFTRKDLEFMKSTVNKMEGKRRIIITTEKDAVRMASNPYFPEDLKPYVFYLPINVEFIHSGDCTFDSIIKSDISKISNNFSK